MQREGQEISEKKLIRGQFDRFIFVRVIGNGKQGHAFTRRPGRKKIYIPPALIFRTTERSLRFRARLHLRRLAKAMSRGKIAS
jgi:hypothetical protein